MTQQTSTPAILVLEDGRTFTGESFGAQGESFGEAVFVTGMTGYQESLTDPAAHGLIVVATAPLVGNTGWNDEDAQSDRIWAGGFVVREYARRYSNWRATGSLADAMQANQVLGITGVDTRALTRHLRDHGSMWAGISTVESDPAKLVERVREHAAARGSGLADVTTPEPYAVSAQGERRCTVALIDAGVKRAVIRMLTERGADVHVLPASATIADVTAVGADGVFFSNGPGHVEKDSSLIELAAEVLNVGLPVFGAGFGHLVLARTFGLETYPLKAGHHGSNVPVKVMQTGKVHITVHSHGCAAKMPTEAVTATPWGEVRVSHVCLNDDVVEGLELTDHNGRLAGFSVQFNPEATAGPRDSIVLFDRFINVISDFRSTEGTI